MKANELRIGNKVWFNYAFEWHITSEDIVALESDSEQFQPIEITEDWLVRFGFVLTRTQAYKIFDDFGNQVTLNKVGKNFQLVYLGVEIKHIHQLQNLYFALTGQELTIK